MPSPDERPAARPRPSFGLPGPTPSGSDGSWGQTGASGQPGAAGQPGASDSSGPTGYVLPPKGQRGPTAAPTGPAFGPAGHAGQAGPGGPMGPAGAAAPARRRGKLPLILGIVLIVVALAVAIIGPVISVRNVVSAIDADGNAISDGKADVQLDEFDMILIYVPSEDAGSAECTSSSPGESSVQTDSGGGQSVTFPNGTSYEQRSGVLATSDTTVTVECTGTSSADAMYVGPINVWGFVVPFFGGIVAGLFVGLIGLVLTIVGIVLLVRTRRA